MTDSAPGFDATNVGRGDVDTAKPGAERADSERLREKRDYLALLAENQRMREALERIERFHRHEKGITTTMGSLERASEIARTALAAAASPPKEDAGADAA